VLRVVGLSSAVLLDKEDPFNPINRRISIIVMNKKAEELVEKDSGSLNVPTDASDDDAAGSARPRTEARVTGAGFANEAEVFQLNREESWICRPRPCCRSSSACCSILPAAAAAN
jgi:hypothetical protein